MECSRTELRPVREKAMHMLFVMLPHWNCKKGKKEAKRYLNRLWQRSKHDNENRRGVAAAAHLRAFCRRLRVCCNALRNGPSLDAADETDARFRTDAVRTAPELEAYVRRVRTTQATRRRDTPAARERFQQCVVTVTREEQQQGSQ